MNAADEPVLAETARHILRPDEDLSGFYEAAHDDPDLAWATDGSGRMLRSRRSSRTSSTQMIRGELLISRERTARRSSLTLDAFPRKTRSTKPRLNAGNRSGDGSMSSSVVRAFVSHGEARRRADGNGRSVRGARGVSGEARK